MRKKITRDEIESKLAISGDFVKIDFLTACLKKELDFDTKKFILITLSKLYESRKMYLESAKMIKASADINTTFKGKMDDFIKSAELYIKGGNFNDADASFNKALALANTEEKSLIKNIKKEYFKTQAKLYLKQDKRANAMKLYELILESFDLDILEKKEMQKTLLDLYQKLGKIREYASLQRSL